MFAMFPLAHSNPPPKFRPPRRHKPKLKPRQIRKLKKEAEARRKKVMRAQRPKPPIHTLHRKGAAPLTPQQRRAIQVERMTPPPRPELAGMHHSSVGLDHYGVARMNAGSILADAFGDAATVRRVRRRQQRRTKAAMRGVKAAQKAQHIVRQRRAIRKHNRAARRAAIRSL